MPTTTHGELHPSTAERTDDPSTVLETLLRERYSCRAFTGDPVPDQVIERILTLAQRSASWCNSQPWHTVITKGEGTERFREVMLNAAQTREPKSDIPEPAEYRGVYLERRRETGFGMYSVLGIERHDRDGRFQQQLENFRLFGAPHVAIVTSDALIGPYGYVDSGAYVSSFLLAAQSLGVATIPQAAIAMHSDVVHEHFGIPSDRVIVCAISFGYADNDHPVNTYRTKRADISAAVDFVDG
ncbi:nitroreductase [Rhodococcus erythropolis]|uniref:nitroreductase n=1 Tax=Rhodococcus erythropolis TaxID=1833 RepID=UPI002227D8F5|nr:nitroreductase [Rhodococcus erythropolis]MCW2295430.1 nitroreductase [Rhodococcus erythropolis]